MTRSRTVLIILAAASCGPADLPRTDAPEYAEAVAAFWRGLAAAQVGETSLADASFVRTVELAPGEPAGWANLAVVSLQRRELEAAAEAAGQALDRAPEDGRFQLLAAIIAQERGDPDGAVAHLRRAVELDPGDVRSRYLLARLLGDVDSLAAAREVPALLDQVLAAQPGNLVVLFERARLAARGRDVEGLRALVSRLQAIADSLAVPVAADVRTVLAEADAGAFDRAATQLVFVESTFQPLAAYREAEATVVPSPTRLDLLLPGFLKLPAPSARAAQADTALTFAAEDLGLGEGAVTWVRAVWLGADAPLALVGGGADAMWVSPEPGRQERLAFPAGAAVPPGRAAMAPLDYDYDYRVDLALAGGGGLRLLRQDETGSFTDVSGTAIPAGARRGPYAGVWAADLDLEGDLDLVLAGTTGPAVALRNRGDGTFEAYPGFPPVSQLRDFVWGDLDADGDPDATLLDAGGNLHVFLNRRSQTPQFAPATLPEAVGHVAAMAGADIDRDATIDLVLLAGDGSVRQLSLDEGAWRVRILSTAPGPAAAPADAAVFVADLDNNGALDIVTSGGAGAQVWMAAEDGLQALPPLAARIGAVADVTGDGRLDLVGTAGAGVPRLLVNQGTSPYYSTTIRPRAAEATGDRRINSFGLGGEIEVRAGLLYQKQLIDQPAVHFGLGQQPQVDVVRVLWPNGSVQAEFNLAATSEAILTRQRLKGSCPWVFTFDGNGMQFVTDFLWRTALGLRINAQGDAAVIHSEDWVRIRGDQLVPRDGVYDVRVTADLWETHFFDHVGLLVVDHPAGTEAFVDERFTLPAPTPAVHLTEPPRPVAWARDDSGRDVTDLIRDRDERFVDTFVRGPYQGVAADHYLEVALGEDAPTTGPLWLVAFGWVYPTDASINVAITQGTHTPPRALQLEVPDGAGGWVVAEPNLGFPAGKTKTVLIDLQHVFRPGTERRIRLRTNMEIYWDEVRWAVALPDAQPATRRLSATRAELRYRGFSRVSQASRTAPELPDYAEIAAAAPLWRDLVGFYTRFGDVRPLTEAVDDRYVIMNAGDELVFEFPALPPPTDGLVRDFVLIGDGWVKDGDLNTGYSTTVLPLPYHGLQDYARPPGLLVDDPGYRRHPDDWALFHTRYVTAREFHRALVTTDAR